MTKTAADVEREVEASRGNLDRTVEALKDRMSPGQLFDEANRAMGGAGQQVLSRLIDQVRENPLPVAMVGLGLAWLMTSQGRSGAHAAVEPRSFSPSIQTYGGLGSELQAGGGSAPNGGGHGLAEGVGDALKSAGGKASDLLHGAKDSIASAASHVGHAGSSAASSVSQAGLRARHDTMDAARQAASGVGGMAQRAQSTVSDLLEREPLLIGALGVMVGIAVGAAIPTTATEDRLMGQARDDLMQKGHELVDQTVGQATGAAQAAVDSVKQGLQNADADATPADRAGDVVRRAVQAAADVLKPETTDTGSGAGPSSDGGSQTDQPSGSASFPSQAQTH